MNRKGFSNFDSSHYLLLESLWAGKDWKACNSPWANAHCFYLTWFKGHPSNANWIYITPVQWIGSYWKDFATNIFCSAAKLRAAVRNRSNVLQDTIQTQNRNMILVWKIHSIKVSLGFMPSPDVAVGMCLCISFSTWKMVAPNFMLRLQHVDMTDGWGAQGHNHRTVIHQTGRVSVPLLLAVVILIDILVTVNFIERRWQSTVRVFRGV